MSRARAAPQLMLAADDKGEATPSKCARFLYYTWKFITCVFSHIMLVSLVVSYCILGAFTFEHLEAENERKVKSTISEIRGNITEDIWQLTKTVKVLHQENWTSTVVIKLRDFEKDILNSMKQKGWDGNEDPEVIQWTFAGALFFSIIVITTIGYGHIAPKTHMGKVVTIFYAIMGIPLMLLCLSNIGDVMATSFRFLYWRVCCYVCTRKPKRKKHRSMRGSMRQPSVRYGGGSRSRTASFRRPVRGSQRSADSAFNYNDGLPCYSYSDTECRYQDEPPKGGRHLRASQMSRFSDGPRGSTRASTRGRGDHRMQRSHSQAPQRSAATPSPRNSSNDRRQKRSSSEARVTSAGEIDARTAARTPVLFNKYAIDDGYGGAKPKNQKKLYGAQGYESEDDLPTVRSKSLPRQPKKEMYQDDDIKPHRSLDRSQRNERDRRDRRDIYYDDETETDNRDGKRNSRGYRNDRSQRDSRKDGNSRSSRDLRRGRDPGVRHSLDVEYGNPRFRSRGSPDDERIVVGEKMSVGRRRHHDAYSDEEFDDSPYYNDDDPENYMSETEIAAQRAARVRRRERAYGTNDEAPSARIMSPMGISVHRQAKYMEDFDIEYAYDDGYHQSAKTQIKPVPIWLCVFLVVSYIIAGAFLFSRWEHWSFLDSAYFCFITLTTIGFGDFVPAQGVKANSEVSIALCSLYLLFGISLLAMSFNLVQEEVIANVKSVAKRLGIIKPELGDNSDDDE